MIEASGLKSGMVIMLDGELHSVASAGYHAGGGQQGSAVFAKVRNLRTSHVKALRLHPGDKLEESCSITRRWNICTRMASPSTS